MTSFDPHDLNWLAFRYVAGEMPDDERMGFEVRLEDDQAAREAVASAVELAQAVALATGDAASLVTPTMAAAMLAPQRRDRAVRGRRLLWVGLGAAACLTLVVLVRSVLDTRDAAHQGASGPTHDPQHQQLAIVWSQTRQATDGDTEFDVEEEITPVDEVAVVEARSATPSWIVAALTDLERSPRPDRDPADEREEL